MWSCRTIGRNVPYGATCGEQSAFCAGAFERRRELYRWSGLVMLFAPLLPLGNHSTNVHNIAREPLWYGYLHRGN